MPEIKISVGNREYEVACAEGEEHFLQSAAGMLDTEAQVMLGQIRHLTESRTLLMAGLMLADKTAGLDDQLQLAQKKIAELEARLGEAKAEPAIPDGVMDAIGSLAAKAEALADEVEAKAG